MMLLMTDVASGALSLTLRQALRALFPVNLGQQHELNRPSTSERTLPPRNSLTIANDMASPKT